MTTEELISSARGWLGVPYRHQGRNRFGVDCIGFPLALLRELGALPQSFRDVTTYGRGPTGHMLPIVERYCEPIRVLEPGALVLIKWPHYPAPSHAGIYTGRSLLHAYQRAGGVVEHGYRGAWVKRTHSMWRMPGVIPP